MTEVRCELIVFGFVLLVDVDVVFIITYARLMQLIINVGAQIFNKNTRHSLRMNGERENERVEVGKIDYVLLLLMANDELKIKATIECERGARMRTGHERISQVAIDTHTREMYTR